MLFDKIFVFLGLTYLFASLLVFFNTFLNLWGILFSIVFVYFFYKLYLSLIRKDIDLFNKKDIVYWIIAVILIMTWVFLSGIGGFAYQNDDFWARNAIYRDLINYDWPVIYDLSLEPDYVVNLLGTDKVAFSYYYIFWLPIALISKTFNLSWSESNLLLYFYVVLGLLLVLYFLFSKQNILVALYVIIIDIIYYIYARKCNNKNNYYLKKQIKYADKMTGMLSQILIGLKDIKSFNIGSRLNNKLDTYRKKWQENYFLKRKYYFTRKTLVGLVIDFGKIILYFIVLVLLIKGKIQIAMFLLLISYYDKTKESINDIMEFDVSIMEESVSLYRINQIVNYKDSNLVLDGIVNNDDIAGYVEFKNVSFKYSRLQVLKNVSFTAKPNQITAIVGKTGSGKTTLFNLLLRMYRVNDGKILIDRINIYDYSRDVFNSNVSIVNQKTFIFNMSIRANLSLIDSNKKRLIDACKRVGIHDFIMSLPDGYSTILKEDATNISGGQKQLLSLARALLTSSEIILLDEVTSSLDPNTTNKIINLLDDLKTDHTIIVITHNKDLMRRADKLVVLNNGKIECVGNNNDLIKKNKVYKQLVTEN